MHFCFANYHNIIQLQLPSLYLNHVIMIIETVANEMQIADTLFLVIGNLICTIVNLAHFSKGFMNDITFSAAAQSGESNTHKQRLTD